ncbi:hypothetical protein HA402_005832 [Bradysia odoriphaga]|nr:hypothetical protein HA402_005832 [Bradysia odoriphaga]
MRLLTSAMLASKFRGSMLGALAGDCCGSLYEGENTCDAGERLILKKYFDKLEGPYFTAPAQPYTDDTAMSICVANVLIEHGKIDQKQLAVRFVKEYFTDSRRGYGGAVINVFGKLRKSKFVDPLQPASEQFGGTGSYGNGGAMRVNPVALFCHNKTSDEVVKMAKQSAVITHTHKQGVDGTVLQALAVHAALLMDPEHPLNTQDFVSNLIDKMKAIEVDEEGLGLDDPSPFTKQLEAVSRFLTMNNEPSDADVVNVLGNDVSALYSVPTSIYCFLRAQKAINGIHSENPLRRAIEYAISLGGDTDTIASMAGAISGAYYGESVLPVNLVKHLELHEEITVLADKLYEASLKA